MADEKKYNIISVNSDEDDEIVIEAGARKRSQRPSSDPVREEDVIEPESDEDEGEDAGTAAPSAHVPAEEAKKPVEDGGYQETTLEDLKSEGPMTRMRLIILGLALLVLVGFLIYYNFLR